MVLSARVHCQESGEESSETESIYALKCHISHEVNHLHEGLKHVSDISWRSYNASSLLFVIMWSCITSNDIIVWVQHCSFNEFFPWLDLVIYAHTRVRTHTHTHIPLLSQMDQEQAVCRNMIVKRKQRTHTKHKLCSMFEYHGGCPLLMSLTCIRLSTSLCHYYYFWYGWKDHVTVRFFECPSCIWKQSCKLWLIALKYLVDEALTFTNLPFFLSAE